MRTYRRLFFRQGLGGGLRLRRDLLQRCQIDVHFGMAAMLSLESGQFG